MTCSVALAKNNKLLIISRHLDKKNAEKMVQFRHKKGLKNWKYAAVYVKSFKATNDKHMYFSLWGKFEKGES
jgi:hypothetical protein